MPGVKQTTNSELTAVITSDPEKGQGLSEMYKIKYYTYEQYGEALKEGLFDAVYVATPNWMHEEFTVPALEAGYHVLLEKPMEINEELCKKINDAAAKSGAKLMIAYRLHFEPGTVEIVNRVRKGDLGDPRVFNCSFSLPMKEWNHRAKNGYDAGPVPDMGTYPINAVRTIFGMEPTEVSAVGFTNPAKQFGFHDTVSVTLRFPGERVGTFTVSYAAAQVNRYSVMGTEGELQADPAFLYGPGVAITYNTIINGKSEKREASVVDHFAGETDYFSQCIIDGKQPEPDGDEGLRDVRVIEAIKRSLETGQIQKLAPLESRRHITEDQVRKLKLASQPSTVINAEKPNKE